MSDASLTPGHHQLVNSRSVFMIPQHDARFNVCVSALVCKRRVWALHVCLCVHGRAFVCVYERSTSYQRKSRGENSAFLKICFTDGPMDQRTDRLMDGWTDRWTDGPTHIYTHIIIIADIIHVVSRFIIIISASPHVWTKDLKTKWWFFCSTETYAKFLFCIEYAKMKKTKT